MYIYLYSFYVFSKEKDSEEYYLGFVRFKVTATWERDLRSVQRLTQIVTFCLFTIAQLLVLLVTSPYFISLKR